MLIATKIYSSMRFEMMLVFRACCIAYGTELACLTRTCVGPVCVFVMIAEVTRMQLCIISVESPLSDLTRHPHVQIDVSCLMYLLWCPDNNHLHMAGDVNEHSCMCTRSFLGRCLSHESWWMPHLVSWFAKVYHSTVNAFAHCL